MGFYTLIGYSSITIAKVCTNREKKKLFSPGIEPGTFRVLGGCDNHYTTKTRWRIREIFKVSMLFYSFSDALTDLVGDIRTVEGINGTASIWATYPTAGISTVR